MDWGPLVTTAISAFAGIVGAFFTWLATRPKNKAEANAVEAQTELTSISGFQILVRELQAERVQLIQVIEKQGGQIEKQSAEIAKLRGVVSNLRSDLDDALAAWRRGEPAPPPKPRGNRA
ncbi:hypothetical protein MMSR116_11160 [Methylobacterium mesophilicum SR1.6/6]|uniref:Uncharacterized protein n=1 Tax=Methylobacterium mesophilicum SR1.6/6 TaxID=908290 RepID=A0A6B9FK78_9HYPH|nr:hypothetical protein [Methylobacterium mesophilicum]QGY02369.1 hypothetical protein MMSR116_11160 [Methylobacterium mesophilicum SR1.6/6]